MGRSPCCDKANVKKGPWSPEEDAKLKEYIEKYGTGGNWITLPKKVGLTRCGKSCRLRWLNYLRPNIKHGEFSDSEDKIICTLFASIGSRWSIIASKLQGRTDNDVKNYWNTKLKKKIMAMNNSHSVEMKPQQVTLLSILQNSTKSSPSLSFSNGSFSTGSFSYSSTSSSLLSGNSSTSAAQESFFSTTKSNSKINQISHVIDQKLVEGNGDATFVQQNNIDSAEYIYSEVEDSEKLMFSNAGSVNGLWGENPLDYGIDEIKQLINTTTSTSSCNNFLFDD